MPKKPFEITLEFMLWLEHFREEFPNKVCELESGCMVWVGNGGRRDLYKHQCTISAIGRVFRVPRIVLALKIGPEFLLKKKHDANALHTCDNGWCVNPDHLFLGTQKDNVADMMAKGRGRGGAKIYR